MNKIEKITKPKNQVPNIDKIRIKPKTQAINKKIQKTLTEKIINIPNGIWADNLTNNTKLPIGGNQFSDKLSTKLNLDFSTFETQLQNFTKENIKSSYEKIKDSLKEWLKKCNSNFDPYTFYRISTIQNIALQLLEYKQTNHKERKEMYKNKNIPNLSELKGKSECGEIAALGQYLYQKLNINSSYVGGITMTNINNLDEYPEHHSYLILQINKKAYIHDIARFIVQKPSGQKLPRIFDISIKNAKKSMSSAGLYIAKNVLFDEELWFGSGNSAAGEKTEFKDASQKTQQTI